jgi:iron complex outermembrane receptor protein
MSRATSRRSGGLVKRIPGCFSVAVLAVTAGARAVAEDEQQQAGPPGLALEEIVITAQKRKEDVESVPIAISSFSAATLQSANVTGLSDLTSVTPGLTFTHQSQSGSPFLRGVGNTQTFAGAEAEVQTYIDNVYYASGAAEFMKFNNIDRIEVDKGPQGTLFGRNATGGVIQIITRDPTDHPTLDASVGYGNFNEKEGDVYASNGFGDKVAGDIAVHTDDREGWGRNVFLNSDAYTAESVAIRSKWILRFSDETRLTLIGDFGRDESDLGQTYTVIGAPWRLSPAFPPSTGLGFYDVSTNQAQPGNTVQYGASAKLDAQLGALSFVSITAYRKTTSAGFVDADGTAAPLVYGVDRRNEKQASQEFQLLSPIDSRLQWITGTYFYYNEASEDPAALSGGIFAPFNASEVDNYSTMTTKSAAVFGQATYAITPSTRITGGVRYTHDYREQEAHVILQYPTGPGAPPPFLGLGVNDYPNATFNAPTGKFSISQDLSEHVVAYASYNRGFKSGTFNNIIVLSNPGPALQPEKIDAYEVGLKADFLDQRMRLDLAAFYYNYSNLQVNIFRNLNIELQNAANSKIKGLDGNLEFAATETTRLRGGFSFLDAKYASFDAAPSYPVNPLAAPNPGGGGFGGIIIGAAPAGGNHLPNAPDWSGYFNINQQLILGAQHFDFNSGLKYQSRTYFTPDNLYSQGGYASLSASAKWTAPSGKWDLTFWGRNLANGHNYSQLSLSAYGVFAAPNEPRVYGARIGVHL